MNILDKIVARKREEILEAKKSRTISDLEKEPLFQKEPLSLSKKLKDADSPQIITEFKRKSPSKGIINGQVAPEIVTTGYTQGGAAALSVLTDLDFFGGTFNDFQKARTANPQIPMLRKDFMVDEYQIYEARSIGADIILLIAACLSPTLVRSLAKTAHSLGLQVLLEVHNLQELQETLCEEVDIVGVNNRNLKTFETSIETSIELSEHIPNEFVKISESGIDGVQTIINLFSYGYKGFLIGETFMKTEDPGKAFWALQQQLSPTLNKI